MSDEMKTEEKKVDNETRKMAWGFAKIGAAVTFVAGFVWFMGYTRDSNIKSNIKAAEEENIERFNRKADMDFKSLEKLPIFEEFNDACRRYSTKKMIREENGDVTLKITLPIGKCRVKNAPKYKGN